ncbi:hypothetical protein BJX70DRAFT_393935 [Aspergillus crustosus]
MRSNTLFLGFTVLTGALAADQVVTIFLPDNEDGPALAGRVLGSAPSTITVLGVASEITGTAICAYDDDIATCSAAVDGEFYDTSTQSVTSYPVTITATDEVLTPIFPLSGSTSPTPSSGTTTTTRAADAQSTTAANTTTSGGAGAQETDGGDNGAMALMSGLSFGAVAAVVGAAVALV